MKLNNFQFCENFCYKKKVGQLICFSPPLFVVVEPRIREEIIRIQDKHPGAATPLNVTEADFKKIRRPIEMYCYD
jgi:hypothetical protein